MQTLAPLLGKFGSVHPLDYAYRIEGQKNSGPPAASDIVLHEMAHLVEPTHNARFVGIMDAYMPNWQFQRGLLNDCRFDRMRGIIEGAVATIGRNRWVPN